MSASERRAPRSTRTRSGAAKGTRRKHRTLRVAVDVSTPKQVRFFRPIIARLRAEGCTVSLFSRHWTELDLMRRSLNLRATVVGRHGGGNLRRKLLCANDRIRLLADHFSKRRPHVLVTLSTADSIRAAFGLKIPIVCFMDLPESYAVSRLTLPLATKVCAPWIIPASAFQRHGVVPQDLFSYRALDPIVWLREHPVQTGYLHALGLDPRRPVVVCRETEWQSAYAGSDIVGRVVKEIRRRHPEWQVVDIPRYRAHPFYDVPSLLAAAHLLIGGGGTMCVEAAYFGTPVIATRAVSCRYMQWLFNRGLAVKCGEVGEVITVAEALIAARATPRARARRRRARGVFRRMTFPLDEVVRLIVKVGETGA